jgi:serine/threonine protein kinase
MHRRQSSKIGPEVEFEKPPVSSRPTKQLSSQVSLKTLKSQLKLNTSDYASPRRDKQSSNSLSKTMQKLIAGSSKPASNSKGIPLLPLNKLSSSGSTGRTNSNLPTSAARLAQEHTVSENVSFTSSANMTQASNLSILASSNMNTSISKYPSSTRNSSCKAFDWMFQKKSEKKISVAETVSKTLDLREETPASETDSIKFPITATTALRMFKDSLSTYEQGEILDFMEVHFLGLGANKTRAGNSNATNFGYDDERGDYKIVIGDHLAYRYEILQVLGKGSFGQVVKALDHKTSQYVALKVIRNKSRFHHQAAVEVKILKYLKDKDPENVYNVIHLHDFFLFRKHLCITFELLSINLYEFIKSNHFHGLSLTLIRRFAYQILQSLKLARKLKIIHCDLKPENILLKQANRSGIKVIDFGSSCFEDEKVYTYIQSRFYRAPEIILGISYTTAIDMWSFGCILAELYTGYPLFPGENESEQISCIMEVKGVPPADIMEKATRKKMFFDTAGNPRILANSRGRKRYPGTKDIKDILKGADADFLEFILGCLEWNPDKRMTPDEALRHPWIMEGAQRSLLGPSTSQTSSTPRGTSVQPQKQPKPVHKHKFSMGETAGLANTPRCSQFKQMPHTTRNGAGNLKGFVFG